MEYAASLDKPNSSENPMYQEIWRTENNFTIAL